MFEHYPSRSGSVSASYGGKQLHSSFDPEREAERFLRSELPEIARTVILIGPGLGHLVRAITAMSPDSRVVSMFLSSQCHKHAIATGDTAWHPGSGLDPSAFLSAALGELESGAVSVLEWPPAAACFEAEAARVREAVSTVIRQNHASLLTEGANGRRWFANLIRNFTSAATPVSPEPAAITSIRACCIAAAGPSLENSLAAIAPFRSGLSLWVLGSALEPVLAQGLEPDLLITTDAALYASEYLRDALTRDSPVCPIAAPLTASRGIGDCCPLWPLSQNDPIETMLYEELSPTPHRLSPHGTVAGTAIQLALSLQPWPVIIAGMDLAWHGMQSHARPHVAQVYRDLAGSRLSPPMTALYAQARDMIELPDGWSTNPTLQVYSRWFDRMVAIGNDRLHCLGPSPATSSLRGIGPEWIGKLPKQFYAPVFGPVTWPGRGRRREMVSGVIDRCSRALAPLADSIATTALEPLQEFLLRRLALDSLLRWTRSRSDSDLREAALAAVLALTQVGESR